MEGSFIQYMWRNIRCDGPLVGYLNMDEPYCTTVYVGPLNDMNFSPIRNRTKQFICNSLND
jgi:hypothetical protein